MWTEQVKVAAERRKLHSKELCNVYSSSNINKKIKSSRICAKHGASMGEMRNEYKILFGKPGNRKPLGRPKSRWKNIRMDHT
jgi:hypothetical protein